MSVCPLNTQLMDICILIYSGCLEKDWYQGLYMHRHGSLCTLNGMCVIHGNNISIYRWVNLMCTIYAYAEFHNDCLVYRFLILLDSWKDFIFCYWHFSTNWTTGSQSFKSVPWGIQEVQDGHLHQLSAGSLYCSIFCSLASKKVLVLRWPLDLFSSLTAISPLVSAECTWKI